MNKYQDQSKARLKDKLIDPLDVFDEHHKNELTKVSERARRAFGVALQLFEVLNSSDLDSVGRATALALLNTLQSRFGDK